VPEFILPSKMTVPNVWNVPVNMYSAWDEIEVMLRLPYCVMLPRL
jgi:hypothetical protein